jgi:hypothetical protein
MIQEKNLRVKDVAFTQECGEPNCVCKKGNRIPEKNFNHE